MSKLAFILAVILFLLMFLTAWAEVPDTAASRAVFSAAMDYMDGAHSGDAARIARAVHPELHKVTVRTIRQTGKSFLGVSGSSRLIQLVAANVVPLPEDRRDIEVKILDVLQGLAVVRVTSAMFWDYLQLADIDGEWKIINILWTERPKAENSKPKTGEAEAVEAAALDYIEGAYSGDAARMERALHPELHKVLPVKMPETGATRLDIMGPGMLIEGTRAKMGLLAEDQRRIEVTILEMTEDLAMAKVLSARYYDFLQMAKIAGQWKIVNVLWVMNPAALPAEKNP